MAAIDVPFLRLCNSGLLYHQFESPAAVIEHMGAIQAQDFAAAKWGIGLRMKKSTDAVVDKGFNDSHFLRTHILRPTWHFVLPEDIRWMQVLTAPHVKRILANMDKKYAITEEIVLRSQVVIQDALHGKQFLTRKQLAANLEKNRIPTHEQRLNHLLMHAELDGLICSGPQQGKQFTFALLEEIVPKAKPLDREESVAKLALKYFTGHGPAQLKDFAWWSGLTIRDAREGLSLIEPALTHHSINGQDYLSLSNSAVTRQDAPSHAGNLVFLLSLYDEYIIGYKDRSDLGDAQDIARFLSTGSVLRSVIIVGGKLIGSWKRVLKKTTINIQLNPFRPLDTLEQESVAEAARFYGEFMGKNVIL